ncbi:trans-aconitate 2-methyltransferase protein [Halorhabdus tiamatea SARL4B]|uniref:tRNA(Phe) (4-demethylwyosine(37)-C(7)) aminocarboxypropyltransferase n=1 Tax=Halorhabdus tiamatea SARL4B TaxID=1033806 RepID=F7PJ49_9EURY|nr:class I SAM-dependent methyltransferase family protein [Halorhabdus tiamatea]ERJ06847.1 trans-aconitate 2-methyltransferase protein [Halorhabdus tiamatea SARL4B]CCQ33014.1 tRNA methylase Trm12p Wyeosine biosynthesis [Halorhabdus tiamatea SARL4B]
MSDDDLFPDDGGEGELAVVVEKPRAQQAIDGLTQEGVYDADRSVRAYGEAGVSIPVTAVPETVEFHEVVRQVGDARLRTLADHLRERGWSPEEIDRAPSSWAVIGSVVLVEIDDAPRPVEVGEALLDLHGEADTVLQRHGIAGEHREPDVSVLAGEGDTETIHTEHGTRYAMDLAEVMFSPGNKDERAGMAEAVTENETVLDMFAGIGYFTLPMARAGADVTAVERNPTAFQYLLENARLNDVTDRVQPYRADCREVVEGVNADRVVMGYYDAYEYLDSALEALEPGGTVHLHEATPTDLVFERPIDRLETAANERGRSVEVLDTRRVKSYSEGVDHVVVDARVD